MSSFITCEKHGWSAIGRGCPYCKEGNAPRVCAKHEWAHATKGCPKCTKGIK